MPAWCGDAAFGQQVAGFGIGARIEVEEQDLLAPRRGTAPAGGARGSSPAIRRGRSSRGTSRLRSPCPRRRVRGSRRRRAASARSSPTSVASSPQRSIRMARAPSSAALASATPLSASTKAGGVLPPARSDRIGQQTVGQRLQPGLARDLRLGAALGLVRQVQVFQARLAVGGLRCRARSSSVSLPCSSMLASTAARRSSSSRR